MARGSFAVVEVQGMRQVRRALRQIENDADRKALGQALKAEYLEAAEVVAKRAQSLAPRRTGALAGSIKAKGALGGASITVGGTKLVRHAGPVHWGWPTRPNKAKGWRGGPIKANRFVVNAAEQVKAQVAAVIEKGLRRFISEQMAGASRG